MATVTTTVSPAVTIVLGDLQRNQKRTSSQKYSKNEPSPDIFEKHKSLEDASVSDPKNDPFEPFIFTSWKPSQAPPWLDTYVLQPYIRFAQTMVRKPSDVIYVSHILTIAFIGLPSIILLFIHFTWIHALFHALFILYFLGPYTIITHHYTHGRGILSPAYFWLDFGFPIILGPLFGLTWNSFHYHHKIMHHTEENGPDDLSSTIRYQRDSGFHLFQYVGKFVLLGIWFELPLYFFRNGRTVGALKCAFWELLSMGFIASMMWVNPRAGIVALAWPVVEIRSLIMINNWGQHVFVDEIEPTSTFRSSITLIGYKASNHSLNDGYHTSHHLSPRRHWREHPFHFIKSQEKYSSQGALTFHNIDFIALAIFLCQKKYDHVAKCLVPMGDQVGMTQEEIVEMLKRKTKRFSEKEIVEKYRESKNPKRG